MNIIDFNSDILSVIISHLDNKDIKNLYYSNRKFRYTIDKRIEIIFLDKIQYKIKSIEHLEEIKCLNPFIRNIRFKNDFNQLLDSSLKGLPITNLHLGICFNQPLEESLKGLELLKTLKLDKKYEKEVLKSIGKSIKVEYY